MRLTDHWLPPARIAAINRFGEVRSALFPAEQARIVRLLVDQVTVTADGLAAVVREMLMPQSEEAVA